MSTAITYPNQRVFEFPGLSRARFEHAALWFTFAISSIVWIEPAPFDLLMLAFIGIAAIFGMRIPRGFAPLIALMALLSVSGMVASLLSDTALTSGRHVLISIFLYVVTIGLAAYVARDPLRVLPIIMNGYTIAAVVATIAGIIGYFSLVDGTYELFTERDRARGTFKDPNVFGPFLVIPVVHFLILSMTGKRTIGGIQSWLVALICFGLLLSYSRGAWANAVLASAVATYLLFVSSRSNSVRLKIVGLTTLLGLLSVAGILFALSFDTIANMFSVRGQLVQSYDVTERFAGADRAIGIILENPLGLGAMSFTRIHGAEPHNVYLYSFLIGGWIGGFSYLILVAMTLYLGFRATLANGPLRPYAILFFATFLANALEGFVVDTDHWRHFYFLMACIWGMTAYMQAGAQRQEPEPAAPSTPEPKQPMIRVFERRERDAMLSPHLARRIAARMPWVTRASETEDKPAAMPAPPHRKKTLQIRRNTRLFGAVRKPEKPSIATAETVEPIEDRNVFGIRSEDAAPARTHFGRRKTSDD